MSAVVRTTHQAAQDMRVEQVAYEGRIIGAALRAFDRAFEAGGGMKPEGRRAFHDCHLETAALLMTMAAGTPRNQLVAFVALGAVWRDFTAASADDRREAGLQLVALAATLRRSRGLA